MIERQRSAARRFRSLAVGEGSSWSRAESGRDSLGTWRTTTPTVICVPNIVDDFPRDAAASLDTDGDGFPDAWNPGQATATSTTGLPLDAFRRRLGVLLEQHRADSERVTSKRPCPHMCPIKSWPTKPASSTC